MASDDLIPMEGTVESIMRDQFNVKCIQGGKEITVRAKLSGKIRQNKIRIVIGDRVTVEVSPYQLDMGRLTKRH